MDGPRAQQERQKEERPQKNTQKNTEINKERHRTTRQIRSLSRLCFSVFFCGVFFRGLFFSGAHGAATIPEGWDGHAQGGASGAADVRPRGAFARNTASAA